MPTVGLALDLGQLLATLSGGFQRLGLGLGDQLNKLPHDLSGGQKQRVAIARALAARPRLLLADEPTAALDSKTGREVVELLQRLAREQGCAVLMVTHDVDEALLLADRVVVMVDGVLEHEVTLGAAASHPRSGDRFGVLREQLLGMLGVHGH